mgnify:CR=1 FL=1
MRNVKIAAIQMQCSTNLQANLEKAEKMVRQAAGDGAQIILLPELFEREYFCQQRRYDFYSYAGTVEESEAVAMGVRLAKETFNPRLGIEGGLSVLGTTGIVNPMSEQALIDTIEVEMKVCLAEKYRYLIVAPGNYGLDFLKEQYSIEENDVVKCSNYIGQTIDMAVEMDCKGILLVGHIGKLIKVSGGIMNTHSRWADCRMDLFATAALRAGIEGKKAAEFLECVTTDDALEKCSAEERLCIMEKIMMRMEEYLNYRGSGKIQVGAVTFSNVYGVLGKTKAAEELIEKFRQERQIQ